MRFQNNSSVPTETIEELVAFITAHLPLTSSARFEAEPKPDGVVTSGIASYREPGVWPVLIRLWFPPVGARVYPTFDQYVTYLPPVWLRSREEEVLLVLAHECRHAHQFMTPKVYGAATPLLLEEDAEEFAYQLLFLWRLRKPGRCRIVRKSL